MASRNFSSDRPLLRVVRKRIRYYKKLYSPKFRGSKSIAIGQISKPIVDALMEELGELRSKLISALEEERNQTMATSVLRTLVRRIKKYEKKRDQIVRVEESHASGETLKEGQEEVLRFKPIVAALMKELIELTWPLISALKEELRLICEKTDQFDAIANTYNLNPIEQLLFLVTLASLLDARSQNEFPSVTLMRRYDKGCLMYDYMTDKEVQLSSEYDRSFISLLGTLVTSQPVTHFGSHRLQFCKWPFLFFSLFIFA